MKLRRKIWGAWCVVGMIVLVSSAALAQPAGESASKNREPGVPGHPGTSNQTSGQQQSKPRDSSESPREGKVIDGNAATGTTGSKDSGKTPSEKKVPMGSGGGGVTGAVGR